MKLHEQVKLNAARNADVMRQIEGFRSYLRRPKFQDHDYIDIHEVIVRLRQIENVLSGVEDDNL
jgi:hypothetical protein